MKQVHLQGRTNDAPQQAESAVDLKAYLGRTTKRPIRLYQYLLVCGLPSSTLSGKYHKSYVSAPAAEVFWLTPKLQLNISIFTV